MLPNLYLEQNNILHTEKTIQDDRKGVGGSLKHDKGGREGFIKWDMRGRRMAQMGVGQQSKK